MKLNKTAEIKINTNFLKKRKKTFVTNKTKQILMKHSLMFVNNNVCEMKSWNPILKQFQEVYENVCNVPSKRCVA